MADIRDYKERFSEDQIREFNDAFCLLDTDHNGTFRVDELRQMLLNIGYNPTDQLLENLTIVIDDGNGLIDFKEFMELINRLETDDKNTREAKDSFNAFDFEGNGFVAANDIREALMHVMEKASETDKAGILKHYRLEKNRKIYFNEFKGMISAFKTQTPS